MIRSGLPDWLVFGGARRGICAAARSISAHPAPPCAARHIRKHGLVPFDRATQRGNHAEQAPERRVSPRWPCSHRQFPPTRRTGRRRASSPSRLVFREVATPARVNASRRWAQRSQASQYASAALPSPPQASTIACPGTSFSSGSPSNALPPTARPARETPPPGPACGSPTSGRFAAHAAEQPALPALRPVRPPGPPAPPGPRLSGLGRVGPPQSHRDQARLD